MRLLPGWVASAVGLLAGCVDQTSSAAASSDASDDGAQCKPSSAIDITISVGAPDAARACDERFLFEAPESAPPAYCVAPCIWNALESCAQAEAASCIERPGGAGLAAPLLCDPGGGWQFERKRLPSGSWQTRLRSAGRVCATALWGGDIVNRPAEVREYTYQGRPVAVATRNVVQCGTSTFAELLARPSDAGPPPCSREYRLEPSRPECAKWASLIELQSSCTAIADGG